MSKLNRRDLIVSLASAAWSLSASCSYAEPAALIADIDLLERIYETLHPGLYRYQTPAQFKAKCATMKLELKATSGVRAQYLALSRLLAEVKCGHTYANFFNQSKAISSDIVDPANKLPFHFLWMGSKMVVSNNPLNLDGLKPGDEIVAINGVASGVIEARLLPYVRADGSNNDKRRALLSVTGADRIETFDVLYPLVFPGDADHFRLTIRAPITGRLKTVRVAAIDQKAREGIMPTALRPDTPEYWALSWPEAKTAVMTMPGWAMYNVTWDWRARITAMFDEMATREATGLVIDLRANEGGNDCGYALISHLIDQDLPVFPRAERRVRFRSTPDDLNPYLDTWDRSFEHLGEGADDLKNGFYRLKSDENDIKSISPQGPRFKGKVIVLSSAQNSSATFQFIDLMRRSGLARIYGQPTGGNQRGINGGSFFFVRLPHSGLEADLPLVGFFPLDPKPNAGLAPDVRIDPMIEDVANGYDRVLQRALSDLT